MMVDVPKVIVFDLGAEYGQFRKYFTNMSPLTFSIAPRTVISGIIGALIGVDKHKNPELFSFRHSFIALRILSPINKTTIATNYLKTDKLKYFSHFEEHKPTIVEYVRNPHYRIYFYHDYDDIYSKLKDNLAHHRSFYTVTLGISSCLANFNFVGEYNTNNINNNEITNIVSILPVETVKELSSLEDVHIQKTTMPAYMNNHREVQIYREYFFELNGKPLKVKVDSYLKIIQSGENIIGM